MADLILHGREVGTVFGLLGSKENAITYSFGWAISRSDAFLRRFLRAILPGRVGAAKAVYLQEHATDGGFTDIEVVTEGAHVIVEAKRGWNLPSKAQLAKYARRLSDRRGTKRLVVLSECTRDYAIDAGLPRTVNRVPVTYVPWDKVYGLAASTCVRKRAERFVLSEFRTYLEAVMDVQKQESNLVYVVALSKEKRPWCSIYPIDWVEKKRRYFHPYNWGGWPLYSPNYLGFRYGGRLQRIHHVEKCEVVENLFGHFREVTKSKPGPFFLYRLGSPIIPAHEVKTGQLFRSQRVWAALDLLLTCKTISRARDLTKKRLNE